MGSQLLTPQVLDDEFSRGYKGRLKLLNGFTSANELLYALRNLMLADKAESNKVYPDAFLLANAANIPVDQFVRNHSLLPLLRAVTQKDSEVAHGDTSRLDIIRLFGMRNCRGTPARYCPACIDEDTRNFGFSYWHRSHQLPGIYWCHIHRVQLANCSFSENAFDEIPIRTSNLNLQFSQSNFVEISNHPITNRYAAILSAFLKFRCPMLGTHARFRISNQIRKHGLRYNVRGKQIPLSDWILSKVPDYWVETLYPGITNKQTKELFYPIDHIVSGVVRDETYALAMATLFESAEDAVRDWTDNNRWLPSVRNQRA